MIDLCMEAIESCDFKEYLQLKNAGQICCGICKNECSEFFNHDGSKSYRCLKCDAIFSPEDLVKNEKQIAMRTSKETKLIREQLLKIEEYYTASDWVRERIEVIVRETMKRKFQVRFLGDRAFISSLGDAWYFDYTKTEVRLLHIHSNRREVSYHFQKKFKTVGDLLGYLSAHDRGKYGKRSAIIRGTIF